MVKLIINVKKLTFTAIKNISKSFLTFGKRSNQKRQPPREPVMYIGSREIATGDNVRSRDNKNKLETRTTKNKSIKTHLKETPCGLELRCARGCCLCWGGGNYDTNGRHGSKKFRVSPI